MARTCIIITTMPPALLAAGGHGFATIDGDGALTIYLDEHGTPQEIAQAEALIRAQLTAIPAPREGHAHARVDQRQVDDSRA